MENTCTENRANEYFLPGILHDSVDSSSYNPSNSPNSEAVDALMAELTELAELNPRAVELLSQDRRQRTPKSIKHPVLESTLHDPRLSRGYEGRI